MNADCKGALENVNKYYRFFEHNGKSMSKKEVTAVLKYAIAKGYEHTGLLTDDEIDSIIKKVNK